MTENFSKGKPKKYGSLQQGAQAGWRPPWRRCHVREDPKDEYKLGPGGGGGVTSASGSSLGKGLQGGRGLEAFQRCGDRSIAWNEVQETAAWEVGLVDPR